VSVAFLAISGIGVGLGYFLFFTGRFRMSAPKRIVLSDGQKFLAGKSSPQ
jgi:hypothetical protein